MRILLQVLLRLIQLHSLLLLQMLGHLKLRSCSPYHLNLTVTHCRLNLGQLGPVLDFSIKFDLKHLPKGGVLSGINWVAHLV